MNRNESISRFLEIIAKSRRIVFFGGAGVSTSSGIPDFRSDGGLYAKEDQGLSPEMILSRSFFYLQPERFFDFYRKHMLYPDAEPNTAHRFWPNWRKGTNFGELLPRILTDCTGKPETSGFTNSTEMSMRTPVWNAMLPIRWT